MSVFKCDLVVVIKTCESCPKYRTIECTAIYKDQHRIGTHKDK